MGSLIVVLSAVFVASILVVIAWNVYEEAIKRSGPRS
jgi:hypothetical protein